jgi:hypothetical protein
MESKYKCIKKERYEELMRCWNNHVCSGCFGGITGHNDSWQCEDCGASYCDEGDCAKNGMKMFKCGCGVHNTGSILCAKCWKWEDEDCDDCKKK